MYSPPMIGRKIGSADSAYQNKASVGAIRRGSSRGRKM
jgi:hypothetical protein